MSKCSTLLYLDLFLGYRHVGGKTGNLIMGEDEMVADRPNDVEIRERTRETENKTRTILMTMLMMTIARLKNKFLLVISPHFLLKLTKL